MDVEQLVVDDLGHDVEEVVDGHVDAQQHCARYATLEVHNPPTSYAFKPAFYNDPLTRRGELTAGIASRWGAIFDNHGVTDPAVKAPLIAALTKNLFDVIVKPSQDVAADTLNAQRQMAAVAYEYLLNEQATLKEDMAHLHRVCDLGALAGANFFGIIG